MNPDPGPLAPSPMHLLDVNVLLAAIWANHPQHADLAAKHGARLATFDQAITHPVVDVIPQ